MQRIILVFLLLVGLGLTACSPRSDSAAVDQRMDRLEKRLDALETGNRADMAKLTREVAGLREALEKALTSEPIPGESADRSPDRDLDEAAREFARENMEKMLDLTRRILDRLEREVDERLRPDAVPESGETQTEETI